MKVAVACVAVLWLSGCTTASKVEYHEYSAMSSIAYTLRKCGSPSFEAMVPLIQERQFKPTMYKHIWPDHIGCDNAERLAQKYIN